MSQQGVIYKFNLVSTHAYKASRNRNKIFALTIYSSTRHLRGNLNLNIAPIILCGGSGSRLWPLSRAHAPKQFHRLAGRKTMLVATLDRVAAANGNEELYGPACVIGSTHFAAEISEQCRTSIADIDSIILEPCMRETSAAIAAAIAELADTDPNQIVLVLPSDHHVTDIKSFNSVMQTAAQSVAVSGGIMTIGIKPTRPETQFGYIEHADHDGPIYDVLRFKEKPNAEDAKAFLEAGSFFWNGGIFMFRVKDMVTELERQQPDIWHHAKLASQNGKREGNLLFLREADFEQCKKISIDYGIMQSATHIRTIEASFDWSDLGSWNRLYEISPQDKNNNVLIGDIVSHKVSNSYIRVQDRPVAVAGIDDLVIVSLADALMVVHRDKSHMVKELHDQISKTSWPPKMVNTSGKTVPYIDTVKNWVFDKALPFWAEHGFDYKFGGAHEALDYAGNPVDLGQRRLRVTARQIYCYAKAYELGWNRDECVRITDHCLNTLITTGWHDDGGFIHLYNPDGTIQDDMRDMYDQCFVLLAMATLWQATKSPLAKEWGEKTLKFVDETLADPDLGGYFETTKKSDIRRANPHMHFFEAMLAWYEATGEQDYLDRAAKLVDLFKTKFFDHENWRVHEMFDTSWTPLEDGTNLVEPGHHYEWVWLLLRYSKMSGDRSVYNYARKIYATALSFGHHVKTDGVAQFVNADGTNLSPIGRMWCQTEALKASIAMEQHNMHVDGNLQVRMLDQLYNRYLNTPIEGGWYDGIDDKGHVVSENMPSSTFYHVFCAFIEYLEHKDAL